MRLLVIIHDVLRGAFITRPCILRGQDLLQPGTPLYDVTQEVHQEA